MRRAAVSLSGLEGVPELAEVEAEGDGDALFVVVVGFDAGLVQGLSDRGADAGVLVGGFGDGQAFGKGEGGDVVGEFAPGDALGFAGGFEFEAVYVGDAFGFEPAVDPVGPWSSFRWMKRRRGRWAWPCGARNLRGRRTSRLRREGWGCYPFC